MSFSYGMGFGGFGLFELLFCLAFIVFIGFFIATAFRGARTWSQNNRSPRLTVSAAVVAKRTQVSGGGPNHHASTSCYATFQVESGDRMEFSLSGSEYGMLVEGDRGKLTFQGTRFLSFEREIG